MVYKPTRTSQVQFQTGGTANYNGLLKIADSSEDLAKVLGSLGVNRLKKESRIAEAKENRQAVVDGSQIFTATGDFISAETAKKAQNYAYSSSSIEAAQARDSALISFVEAKLIDSEKLVLQGDPFGDKENGLKPLNDIVSEAKGLIGENEIVRGLLDTLVEKKRTAIQVRQALNVANREEAENYNQAVTSAETIAEKYRESAYLAETPTELHTLLTEGFGLLSLSTDVVETTVLPNVNGIDQASKLEKNFITGVVGNFLVKQGVTEFQNSTDKNVDLSAPPAFGFYRIIESIRDGSFDDHIDEKFRPFIDKQEIINMLQEAAQEQESLRSKQESDLNDIAGDLKGNLKDEMAKFTDVSKLDDFYNNTVKTKTGLQKGDFAELAGAYRTLRTNIISNNTATLAAGKKRLEQQLGTRTKEAQQGVYPTADRNDESNFGFLRNFYVDNADALQAYPSVANDVLLGIKAITDRTVDGQKKLFGFHEEIFKAAPIGSALRAKHFASMQAIADEMTGPNSTELKGKLVKIADEHEDAKTQIQVKADITNLGNSVPLQNYANVNELEAAIMTLGNADDLMVTFLNAENTNLVKLFSREMNAAASVFKARHNIDSISAGNILAGKGGADPSQVYEQIRLWQENAVANNPQGMTRGSEKFDSALSSMMSHAEKYAKKYEEEKQKAITVSNEMKAFKNHARPTIKRSLVEEVVTLPAFDLENPEYVNAVADFAMNFGIIHSSFLEAANTSLIGYTSGIREDTDDDEGASGTQPVDKVKDMVSVADGLVRRLAATNKHLTVRGARALFFDQLALRAQGDIGTGSINPAKAFNMMFHGVSPENAINAATKVQDMESLNVKVGSMYAGYKKPEFDMSKDSGAMNVFIDISQKHLDPNLWGEISLALGMTEDSEMYAAARKFWDGNKPPDGWIGEQLAASPMVKDLVIGTFRRVLAEYSVDNATDLNGVVVDTWNRLRSNVGIELRRSGYLDIFEKSKLYDPGQLLNAQGPATQYTLGMGNAIIYTITDSLGLTDHNTYSAHMVINPITPWFQTYGNFPNDGILDPKKTIVEDVAFIVNEMDVDFMYRFGHPKEDFMQGIANGDIIFTANSRLGDTPESQTYTVSVKTPDGTQTPIMENYSPDFEAMKVSGIYDLAIQGVHFGKQSSHNMNETSIGQYTEDEAQILFKVYRDTALIGRYALRKAIEREMNLQSTVGVADAINVALNTALEASQKNMIIGLDPSKNIEQQKYNFTDADIRRFASFFQSVFNIPDSRWRKAGMLPEGM